MSDRWVEPLGLLHGPAAFHAVKLGLAMPLAGGASAFTLVRLIEAGESLGIGPLAEVPEPWSGIRADHGLASPLASPGAVGGES